VHAAPCRITITETSRMHWSYVACRLGHLDALHSLPLPHQVTASSRPAEDGGCGQQACRHAMRHEP
jgi:hypothetical protein